jgi:hypothetical protein
MSLGADESGSLHLKDWKRRSAEHGKYAPARADGTGREIPINAQKEDDSSKIKPQQLGSDEQQKAILTNSAQR